MKIDPAIQAAKPFNLQTSGDLDHYLKAADEVSQQLLASNEPIVQALRHYVDCLRRDVWGISNGPKGDLSILLSINACMLFLAAIRVALSGHTTAVFPVLRTALESAGYALLMSRDPALSEVWAQRHSDAQHRKDCRRAFTFEKVIRQLEVTAPESVIDASDAYESLIDFGAHPNVISVFKHVTMDDQRDDGRVEIGLTALHGATGLETIRGLCACLDIGLWIVALVLMAHTEPSEEQNHLFQRLSDLKDTVTAPYAPDAAEAEDAVDE